MGESRSSESRDSYYAPVYSSYSSESREYGYSSESRDYGYSSESRETSYYNRLDDVDRLIERLSSRTYNAESSALETVMSERKKKIAELRSLKERVERKKEEDRIIQELRNENLELDKAIKDLRRKL